jgi:uncharacterized protein (UPF0276 family)
MSSSLGQQCGIGLKPNHWDDILLGRAKPAWVEIHAENYFDATGAYHRALSGIREICPVSIHGVGLSLGSAQGLDDSHLDQLAALVARYRPALVSEHLAWNAAGDWRLPDLLPIRYDETARVVLIENIDRTQTRLGRPILIETPARYSDLDQDPMAETDFINDIVKATGCGVLVDVNNVYVAANNLGFDARAYLRAMPWQQVGEIHLAGHDRDQLISNLLIDTHHGPVSDEVWALYRYALDLGGPKPSLIEWDTDAPATDVLMQEADKANQILATKPGLTHAA